MAGRVLLALLEGGERESLCLVPDLSLARRDRHADAAEPLRRFSVHEVSQRRDRSRYERGRGDDERRQGARTRHSGIEMGVPAWLRRCQRHLECQRARELSLLAGDPHGRAEGVRDGGQDRRRYGLHRSLFLLPLGGRDRLSGAGHRRGRSARAHHHRRASLFRRRRQRLCDAFHRHHDGKAAAPIPARSDCAPAMAGM